MSDNIFTFKDSFINNDREVVHSYRDDIHDNKVPVVIDNGSSFCRAGWAVDPIPKLNFRNLLARHRHKREIDNQIGNNIANLEAVRWLVRTQFDRDVVTHFDIQEQVLDYIFHHLGIKSEGGIEHPIVVTEAVCNPNYCRGFMTELLFEGYQAPSISYGVDSLFSLFKNQGTADASPSDGIILSLGHHHSHVMPYRHGRLDVPNVRRINAGGFRQATYLQRLLQLRYPVHANAISLCRAEELIADHSYVSKDFNSELERWAEVEYYKKNVHRMQLPYTPLHGWTDDTLHQNYIKLEVSLQTVANLWQDKKEVSEIDKFNDFEPNIQKDFQALLELVAKWQVLSNQCLDLLQEGSKLLKNKASADAIHEWTDRVRASHHQLCENRSDWLNAKEGVRQSCENSQMEDGDEKELMQDIETDDYAEQESYKQVLAALEKLEQDSRPGEAEMKKIESLEHLLRDVEATLNCHSNQQMMTFDLAEYHQIHMGVERISVPEILFQPSIIGLEQGGIMETLDFVLKKFDNETQNRLVQNIFLTGGNAKCPNIVSRVESELKSIRPFQSTFKVNVADDPVLDAWKGAAKWCSDSSRLKAGSTTREEYMEKGLEYLKEHEASNKYCTTPTVKR